MSEIDAIDRDRYIVLRDGVPKLKNTINGRPAQEVIRDPANVDEIREIAVWLAAGAEVIRASEPAPKPRWWQRKS